MALLLRYIRSLINFLAGGALVIMFLALFSQVVSRKLFNNPLLWPEETALIAMIIVTFWGAYLCTAEDTQLRMDFVPEKLPLKYKPYVDIGTKTLVLWFLGIVIIWGVPFIKSTGRTLLPCTGIPMLVPYLCVWVGCVLMFVEIVFKAGLEITKIVRKIRSEIPS